MKYPYIVNKDGVWYPAGTEVPADSIPSQNKTYTKTEINRMSTSDLKLLAKKQSIENAEDKSGAELKKVLIKHMGL